MNKRKISKSETLISSFTEQRVVWSVLPEKCGGERLKLNYASLQVARMFWSVSVRCITCHLLSPSLVVFIVLISNSWHTKSVMEVIQYGAAINIFVEMLVTGTGKIFPIQSHVSKQWCWWYTRVVTVHPIKAYRGSRGIAPCILNPSIRGRWLVSFTPQLLYPQGRTKVPLL